MSDPLTYQKAGVDPEKAASILGDFASYVKTRPSDPRLLSGIGPFAACYSLKELVAEYPDPVLVTSCDGVGTKLKLALDWNSVEGLGQDLVAMNVNDLLCVGAKPFLFLDYFACGVLERDRLSGLLKSIQLACEQSGCSLAGGETAEMPGLYSGKDFDLAGFTVGIVDRSQILGEKRVQAGDAILAIPSSGPHSNGFSLIRKLVERERLGPHEKPSFSTVAWKDLLLAPTTLYVKPVTPVLNRLHALAHITGGGLYENLPRVLPKGVIAQIDAPLWQFPPVFQWMAEKAALNTQQLLSTFNCGVGMIAVLPKSEVTPVVNHLESAGLKAWVIGQIAKGPSPDAAAQIAWRT